ncbi:MAG TPA: DUF4010 domain-containing protein [Rhizomicrobium sp.]|nr:DUF4010 domain-containing protein [Rhizomicrobium sp.]
MTVHDFAAGLLARPEWRLLTALLIGLLIGADRERRKGEGETRAPTGLRTFALAGLLGGVAALTGAPVVILVAGLFAAGAALAGYALNDRRDPGLTTEVALVVTFVLGVLALSQPMLALATGVVVTVLLVARNPLHHFVRETLTERELDDGLLFIFAAAVVLPMLPDRAIDPFGLVNPFVLWRLVVVLIGLSAAAHWAMRLLGDRFGLIVTGFASGFISSSIGIAAAGARTRSDPALATAGAAGAVASMVGSMGYLAALVAAMNLDLVRMLLAPLALSLGPLTLYALLLAWLSRQAGPLPVSEGRAFDPRVVLTFIVLVAVFALITIGLVRFLGPMGMLAGTVATGIADAHAAAVSVAALISSGAVALSPAALALLIGISANMAAKIPTAFALGTRRFGVLVSVGIAILIGGLWAGRALTGA